MNAERKKYRAAGCERGVQRAHADQTPRTPHGAGGRTWGGLRARGNCWGGVAPKALSESGGWRASVPRRSSGCAWPPTPGSAHGAAGDWRAQARRPPPPRCSRAAPRRSPRDQAHRLRSGAPSPRPRRWRTRAAAVSRRHPTRAPRAVGRPSGGASQRWGADLLARSLATRASCGRGAPPRFPWTRTRPPCPGGVPPRRAAEGAAHLQKVRTRTQISLERLMTHHLHARLLSASRSQQSPAPR